MSSRENERIFSLKEKEKKEEIYVMSSQAIATIHRTREIYNLW